MLSKSPREILCLRAISYGSVKGNGESLYVPTSQAAKCKDSPDQEESRKEYFALVIEMASADIMEI